jgi:hypothetical protein
VVRLYNFWVSKTLIIATVVIAVLITSVVRLYNLIEIISVLAAFNGFSSDLTALAAF